MLVSREILGFLFTECYVSISRTFRVHLHPIVTLVFHVFFRIPFQPSVTLVSRTLLGFLFIGVLRQYLVHFQDFCSSDCYISVSNTFRILFIQLLRMYLDCYVSILRTFRNFLHSIVILIVTLVCQELLRFCSIRLLLQCLACFQNSLAFNYHICIPNVTLVSRTLFRFSSIRLIRQCPAHFQNSLAFSCYVCISTGTVVSCLLLRLSFIKLLRQYLAHF